MLLKDKVALITAGAGVGIGRAVATRFLEEGANVVITDAHPRRTFETAAELSKQFGREVPGIGVDVTNRKQVEDAVNNSNANVGGDILTLGSQAHNVRALGLIDNGRDPLDPALVAHNDEIIARKIDDIVHQFVQ